MVTMFMWSTTMSFTMLFLQEWIEPQLLRWPLTVAYLFLLGMISIYGVHRYWLVYLFAKHGRRNPRPMAWYAQLPKVTVQLPMFNEGVVGQRVIDAACQLDYAPDRLQIQVLDDSTDGSGALAQERVAYWAARGVNIAYLHRMDRTGYKAGALANALPVAEGELIAIFDADFIPPASFLHRTVHYFTDPQIGMVQTKWSHLNRDESLLTRGQAIFLDGHFVVEHTARNRSGAWINFNGTAGIWRREAIDTAGGWQHDTLTEDVDLSYRAQLAGWKFCFLPWVRCPAELPPEINAFKSQQHRWTKGSIQTALKLLPRLMRSDAGARVKIEAFFHLTSPMVYLYVTLLALLFYPAIFVNLQAMGRGTWSGVVLGLGLFGMGTISATVFYIASQRAQRRSGWMTVAAVPMLMAIGIGIALNNAVACLEALTGHESPFVRTPKYNRTGGGKRGGKTGTRRERVRSPMSFIPIPSMRKSISILELAMGVYMLECARLSVEVHNTIVSLPFLLLFAGGYLYVGLTSLWVHLRGWMDGRKVAAAAAAA
jgi:cellulose synthase/poly-beta-1,6-N-acetylglucosamine synthase-like glycosyltransferase